MKNVIVVGSGAGGATISKRTSNQRNKCYFNRKRTIYTRLKMHYEHYENADAGVELLKTSCVGGTTVVTAGNAVRTCQEHLKNMGIDLEYDFKQIENEMGVSTLPDSHFGRGTKLIIEKAELLGFNVQKMPKFIDPKTCKPCGKCTFGCPRNSKWTSIEYVNDAVDHGAKLIENTENN